MTSDIQGFQWVDPEYLEPNTFNPNVMAEVEYEAMKEDMKNNPETFFINNLIRVTPKDAYYEDPDEPYNRFIIVDGFHKWKAGKELGLGKVAILIENLTRAQARRRCFKINNQRGRMDPLKMGYMFKLDVVAGVSQEDIAREYGVAQSQVSRSLAFTRLPNSVLSFYRSPERAFSNYRALEWEKMIEDYVNDKVLESIDSHLQATGSAPSDEDVADMEEGIRGQAREFYDRPSMEPTRKLTQSHLEIIVSLPTEELQIYLALRIMDTDQSVRAIRKMAERLKREYEETQLLEKAQDLALLKKCPECGDPIVRAKEVKGELLVSCAEYDYRAHWWPVTMSREDYEATHAQKEPEEKEPGQREARVKLWFKTPLDTEAVDEALGIYALNLSRGFESATHIHIQGELQGIPATLNFEANRTNRVFNIEYAPEIEKPDHRDVLGPMFAYNNEHFEPVLRGSFSWPQERLSFSYKSGAWKTGPHKTRVEVGEEHTAHAEELLEALEVFLVELAEGKVGPLPSRTVGGPLELAREFVEFYEKEKAEKKDL